MAKKVSKNQRTTRGGVEQKQMAKVIVASRKSNGHYEFRQKMVETSRVQEELASVRN